MNAYQTQMGFMSGDITPQSHLPESWVVKEDNIDVSIAYALDVNSEKVADCNIVMNIRANGH